MSTEEAWQRLAAEQLKAIQPADTGTTKAARIRVLLPHIEAAMARNVTQSEIISELAKSGLVMTLDELRNSLYRARKRLKRQANKDTPHEAKNPATPPAPPPADASGKPGQFDWQQHRDKKANW